MTTSEKQTFPVWLLAVAAGGLVGIVAGAFLFFGKPEGGAKTASTVPAAASPAPGGTNQSVSSAGKGGLAVMPKTPQEWDAQIAGAKPDIYGALMDGAIAIPDAAERKAVVEKLLAKWLDSDVSGFLDYLDDLEGSDNGGENAWPVLVPAFIAVLPNVSDAAAEDSDLEEATLWITEYYAEQDPAAAEAWARQTLVGETQDEALSTIAGGLSLVSTDKAVNLAHSLTNPNSRLDAIANIGSTLGEKKPAEALQWAKNLSDPGERTAALEEVFWSMSESDPAMAARELAAMNDANLVESVGSAIAEELADKNPAAAVQWASALPQGTARDEALSGALGGWASNDPKAAYAYLQANARGNGDATEWVFEEWGSQAPEEASAEIGKITDAAAREHAVTGLVNGWLDDEDTQGVEQWVDALPASRERDLASAAIVDALSFDEPQPAWDRALTISDPQLRQDAVMSAFSGLVDSDENAARAALNAPQLSDQDRQLLRPMLDDDSGGDSATTP